VAGCYRHATLGLLQADEDKARMLDTKTVAYHEAGHAVVACRLGIAIARVTTRVAGGAFFGGGWLAGHTQLDPVAEQRAAFQDRVWVALAGAAAQARVDPSSVREGCATRDYALARKFYAELYRMPYCTDKELAGDERRARELVAKHWPSVEAVAQELLKRGSLNGRQVVSLLASVT